MGLDKKIKEMRVLNGWEKIVGPVIAKNTSLISVEGGVLSVRFRSPLVRSEVKMHKTVIIERLNEIAGDGYITDLKIR
jgi:predicted nucleic acid-binding Zn ribbon protein